MNMMRVQWRVAMVVAAAVLGTVPGGVWAEAWPIGDLKAKGKATTPLGDWSLDGFVGRNDFPFLNTMTPLEEVDDGRWELPSHGLGGLQVSDTTIGFRSSGLINDDTHDKWLTAVVFTAKDAGFYKLSGKFAGLWCDLDKNDKSAIRWCVLRGKADGSKFKPLGGGSCGDGETAEFSTVKKLQAVELKAGETLVITLFKPNNWGASGGTLDGVTIEKADAPAATQP